MVTKRAPKPASIREPPSLFRQSVTFLTPGDLKGNQWRQLVGRAPVVRACIQTLVNQLSDLGWYLEGEDDVAYFTKVLEASDSGAGFETMLSRVVEDALVVPFGGAVEFGHFPDGVIAWVQHIDAATMVPTYSQQFPYAQVDPFGGLNRPVSFREEQIGRVRWQAETNIKTYGWTKTPAADCLPAIEGLLRADRFWQSFLLDSPPAGILDLMDFSESEASDWYESWRTMLAGIDPFKVPILYGGGQERKQAAKFIEFHKSPSEVSMQQLIKSYAEYVTACFGMSLGDLGLFGQELRLAGATKLMDLSKRQGLAKLKRGVKSMIDMDVLPDGVEFKWEEMDLEDDLRKAQSKQITGRKIVELVTGHVLTPRQGLKVAIYEEVIPPDVIKEEDWEEPEEPSEEDVEITDEELGGEEEPTAAGVREDLEERASAPPRAFPTNSKWAKEMGKMAQRMTAPARRGATKKRLTALLDVGIKAFEKRSTSIKWTEDLELQGIWARSADDAKAALEAALAKQDWWKSPDLTDDVARILNGAYREGLEESIGEIEASRVALGLQAVDVSTTSLNVTNKATLKLLRERAGEFIQHIDDGTKHYITQSVMHGVREGVASPEIARGVLAGGVRNDLLETFKGRTLSIVNTEINWAESQAALDEQEKLGLAKKRWRTVRGLACPLCKRNEDQGAVDADYEYESVFGGTQTTPGHPGVCLTGDSRVAAQGVAAATERRYHGDLIVLRTRARNELRCTPNHPVLTDHGWLPARLLMEGRYVVSSLRDEWMAVRYNNDHDVPPRIQEIAESLRRSSQVTPVEMKTTAEHFHGDGVGSEVAVIYPDRLLEDYREAALLEHLGELSLCRRHANLLHLARSRASELRFQTYLPSLAHARPLASEARHMGSGNLALALLRRHAVPLQELGLAAVSHMDTMSDERVTDGLPAYPIPCSEAIDRLAGEVFLDELVEVDTLRDWDAHVYNLQTADGFYVANAIVTHNCHCWITFDKAELKGLGDDPGYWMGD